LLELRTRNERREEERRGGKNKETSMQYDVLARMEGRKGSLTEQLPAAS
jgi:hypothetical protein